MHIAVSAILFAAIITGCKTAANQQSTAKNVFGTDGRIKYEKPAGVGRLCLITPGKTLDSDPEPNRCCTGVVIGLNLVATAAHCVLDPVGNNSAWTPTKKAIWFSVGYHYIYNSRQGIEADILELGTTEPMRHTGDDWAVIQLRRPYSSNTSYFKLATFEFNQGSPGEIPKIGGIPLDKLDVSAVTYPGDLGGGSNTVGYFEVNCHIRSWNSNSGGLRHDCASASGSSGGPLFVRDPKSNAWVLVGLVSSERASAINGSAYSDEVANLAIPSYKFERHGQH